MKIRDGDGLLQRYLENNFRGRTFQGDMRRYWSAGNSQSFIFLLSLMKRRALLKEMLDAAEDDTGEATALFDDAQKFYRSFENRAKRSWETLSAPYLKGTEEELEEFIVDAEEEEEGESAHPRFAFEREADPEDEILKTLKRRLGKSEESDSDSLSDDQDDASVEDIHPEKALPSGYYSEEEEEEDEWVTSKMPRRGHKVSPNNATQKVSSKETPVFGKRLGKARGANQSTSSMGNLKQEPVVTASQSPEKKRRTRVIIDSDTGSD